MVSARRVFLLVAAVVAIYHLAYLYRENSSIPSRRRPSSSRKNVAKRWINWPPKLDNFTEMPCETLLDLLATEYVVTIILDINFAEKVIKKENCTRDDYLPKMALPANVYSKWNKDILMYENDPERNYYLFHDVDYRRAIFKHDYMTKKIWREYRNFLLPGNVTLFREVWKRSYFIDCLNDIGEKHEKWDEAKIVTDMTTLVTNLIQFGMYPFICSGTLLGWYRECGFIPYTTDIDFCYRSEEFNPDAFYTMYEKGEPFPISVEFGKHGLNKEYSLTATEKIDLFEVVTQDGSSYISVLAENTSYHNVYPVVYNAQCAADLYGSLFWVTCDPITVLRADYGDGWVVRDPDLYYTKTKNLVKVREYTEEEYQEFVMKKGRSSKLTDKA